MSDRLIEVKTSLAEIDEMYADAGGNTLGCLISGDPGTGKTTLLGTAPKPILIYMFDPRGHIVLREKISKKEVVVVPLWNENSQSPSEWGKFSELTNKHCESGFIDRFATVGIDSLTFALEALTNFTAVEMQGITKKTRVKNLLHMGDYRVVYQHILDKIKQLANHKIHLICTSHLETTQDEVSGKVTTHILAYKKLQGLLPALFTEKYAVVTRPGSSGGVAKRVLLTQPEGRIQLASSQLGLEPVYDLKPGVESLTNIIRAAGVDVNEKELVR